MIKPVFTFLLCSVWIALSIANLHPQFQSKYLSSIRAAKLKSFGPAYENTQDFEVKKDSLEAVVAAMLPGDPYVTGTLTQGIVNAISIYSNVLLARVALSWFPQLFNQFPILRPIITVTEPYLQVFRSSVPSVMGFDISAVVAFFILDIISQTTVAVGSEFPAHLRKKKVVSFRKIQHATHKTHNLLDNEERPILIYK